MTISDYSAIRVSGEDAFEFLQAQLAGDLRLAEDGQLHLSAWCNPKGRVICLFRVRAVEHGFELALPAELAADVMRRLTMFRFRSKVAFDLQAAAAKQLGVSGSFEDWQRNNLRTGIVEVGKDQSEKYTAHMLNLDLLDAVSLEKGCYPGQEIVARTHYRGATKRRCLRFESAEPVAVGDKISDGARDIGEVVNALDMDLLAVLPIDADLDSLSAGDIRLLNLPLPYFEK